ncbi:hypothetical protein MJO28_013955 [Puccinia striiformis f. sp. tritici]|uniref:Uncharacterized protein n=2 Tax=Puccinia striiformis TaxID=27350 RepID=A0A2S4VI64_9BASI|nr:hypothetical protein MJO28_013955 [Puccinia striiformis f. sp. tritici]POW09233.1 hypothetical protein PSTT_06960 [Puccinia striiformis]
MADPSCCLTGLISAPRNTGSPDLLAASTGELGPLMEALEKVSEERREKPKRFKGPFKKGTGNYGPGNSSDAGSKGYVPQAGLSGLDSLELSRDECLHRDNHISYFEQTHAILQLSPSISILIRLLLFVDWVE